MGAKTEAENRGNFPSRPAGKQRNGALERAPASTCAVTAQVGTEVRDLSDPAEGEKVGPMPSCPPDLALYPSPSLLEFGVIFGRSLGQIFFHQASKGRQRQES